MTPSCDIQEGGLRSRFYLGEVSHARLHPVTHRFSYPMFTFVVDLDELSALEGVSKLFGHNRNRIFSVHDGDYLLPHAEGTFRERLEACLDEWGYREPLGRAELVTMPRVFGRAFNPVNFFYLYRPDDTLGGVVTEVNNTFGERHFYVLQDPLRSLPGMLAHFTAEKAFHVSPFYDRSGTYEFHFSTLNGQMDIRVDKSDTKTGVHFLTQLTGHHRPFIACQLRRLLLRAPFRVAKTMPRILWEAAKLHRVKKLPVYTKPALEDPMSIRVAKPNWRERFAQRAVMAYLGRLTLGRLDLVLPDGTMKSFGENVGEPVTLTIKDHRFFPRVLRGGDIGFGEAWMAGEIDTPDLTKLLSLFVRNKQVLSSQRKLGARAWIQNKLNAFAHRRNRNTVAQAKDNIHAHYDLGNDFYRRFLDPSMMYSCALFNGPEDSLNEAQLNKINALIEKADIGAEHHVLEIGCGWGSFAIEAARRTGCRVTGVTISEEQKKWADQKVAEAGLSERVDIQLIDYRHIEGKFDRIVSIEMLEAVGHEFYDAWFGAVERLLAPGGRVAVQVITMPHERYHTYRKNCDWIQKYIFPGGNLPSVEILQESMGRMSDRLRLERVEGYGRHYATTLAVWRREFFTNWQEIKPFGFDERFRRMWEFYLCYCEAGFENEFIDLHHLVFEG